MKKLFALAIVAGMTFASCGGGQKDEVVDPVNDDAIENQIDEQQQDETVEMPEGEETPAE